MGGVCNSCVDKQRDNCIEKQRKSIITKEHIKDLDRADMPAMLGPTPTRRERKIADELRLSVTPGETKNMFEEENLLNKIKHEPQDISFTYSNRWKKRSMTGKS